LSRFFFKNFGKEQADDGTAKIAKLNILSKKSMDLLQKIYIKLKRKGG